ncbi:MAG TPA: CPBP family intramembrane metalloprotease [Bacillota bacterium]|nr:CPBP family intramembrane metalloprotease [Bacillota bacterium]
MDKVRGQYVNVLSAVLAVLLLDVLLYNYFKAVGVYSNSNFIPLDIVLIASAISLGSRYAQKMGFPSWKPVYKNNENRRGLIKSVILGSFIVIINTLALTRSDAGNIIWLNFTGCYQPFLLSLRAALTEEILYRFCIFTVVTEFVHNVIRSRDISLAAGVIASSFLFGLQHQGFYFSFVIGAALCYIYKNNGLIFTMAVHFLADFIPFVIIYAG